MINISLIIICVIGFVLVVIHVLYEESDSFRAWWEKHAIADFPYPAACWDCKETECDPQKCLELGIITEEEFRTFT